MNSAGLTARLSGARILSAAVIDSADLAAPLARALRSGGLEVMEVTLRNPHALECIRRIKTEVPEMTLGAGTLLNAAQIDAAMAAGAAFGVSPGFNPTTVKAALARGFPFIPGVSSPGEMEQALELGCSVMKVFPAGTLGGAPYLRALSAVYAHTAMRLVPLGGIDPTNLREYLAQPIVIAVGGSWLTDRKLAAEGDWAGIAALTRQALALAKEPL